MKKLKTEYLEILEMFLDWKKKIEQVIFGVTIILNMKVMVIEMKPYQLKNILIKLDHS